MKKTSRHFLAMPMLGFAVLAGAGINMTFRPNPLDAEPYQHDVHAKAELYPETVGPWTWNRDYVAPDHAAIALLKPNVLIQREYRSSEGSHVMYVVMDQCPDVRNMLGHYPPECYPGQGLVLAGSIPLTLHMVDAGGDTPVNAMEYTFTDKIRDSREIVIDFFILPSHRYVTDMKDVDEAAADLTRRSFGVAQLQFVFPLPSGADNAEIEAFRGESRKTVELFLSATSDLLKLIYSGGRP